MVEVSSARGTCFSPAILICVCVTLFFCTCVEQYLLYVEGSEVEVCVNGHERTLSNTNTAFVFHDYCRNWLRYVAMLGQSLRP